MYALLTMQLQWFSTEMTWSDCFLQRKEVSVLHQAFHPSPESKPCLSLFFMLSVSLLLTRQKTKWSVMFVNGITNYCNRDVNFSLGIFVFRKIWQNEVMMVGY